MPTMMHTLRNEYAPAQPGTCRANMRKMSFKNESTWRSRVIASLPTCMWRFNADGESDPSQKSMWKSVKLNGNNTLRHRGTADTPHASSFLVYITRTAWVLLVCPLQESSSNTCATSAGVWTVSSTGLLPPRFLIWCVNVELFQPQTVSLRWSLESLIILHQVQQLVKISSSSMTFTICQQESLQVKVSLMKTLRFIKKNHKLNFYFHRLQVTSLSLSRPLLVPSPRCPRHYFLFHTQINLSHFVQNWSYRLLSLTQFCKPLSQPHLDQYCSSSSPLSRFLSVPLCITPRLITNGAALLCPLTW